MDCSTPGFPVHHQLPELAETHVHRVSDAIQPSHTLLSPSPSIILSIKVFSKESVLHIRWPKCWSFSFSISPSLNIQDWFPLGLTGWIPCSLRDSQESSPTPQFKNISSSALSLFYGPTLTSVRDYWKNHSFESVLESFLHFVLNEKQTENSDGAVWCFMLSLGKS